MTVATSVRPSRSAERTTPAAAGETVAILSGGNVDAGLLDWAGVADRMSHAPARIGRVADQGRPLAVGEPANVVLYDPSVRRVVDPTETASLSRNTPYAGLKLPGRVVATYLRGKVTHD